MVVSSEICKKYNYICNANYFQQNFDNWTSSNNEIDKFIQDAQLSAHDNAEKALEWIPYDRFYIKHIAKVGFGKVYRANWIDGNISYWDKKNQNWKRNNQGMIVDLKSLHNSKNITLEFINEV